jgi:hypothetical protein
MELTLKEIKALPLVLICWRDITTENAGWMSIAAIDELETASCYTPGWVVREDKLTYYVVQGWGEHKDVFECSVDVTIPKGCVTSIKIIKKGWYSRKEDNASNI